MRTATARWLSPEQQWMRLKSSPISKGHGFVRRGELVWDFAARPSPIGRIYQLRICYRYPGLPDVFVLSPDLNVLAEGRFLPHVYSSKPVRLCLYYPDSKDWSPEMSIAETIVPWTCVWLFYFEEWLVSDEWQGGGRHPREKDAA